MTHGRAVEQNIRQCDVFGGAPGLLVGTKTPNELEAMASVGDELPKSLFVGQRSGQPQGALDVTTGNAQDVGTEQGGAGSPRPGASCLVLLLNPPKRKHEVSMGSWLLTAALGAQFPRDLKDK